MDDDARSRLLAIGEIAAEVAHELRNALQIIAANVYLAKQCTAPEAPTSPMLAKIDKSARLAQGIVDDLMALARGEPARAEPVPLVDVLLAARGDLPEPAARFEDRLAAPDIKVRAHAGLLARLFHALYENAIGASAPDPVTVETRAHLERGRVVVEVADDGPGVPPAVAEALFEPLVTGRAGGTGLGLALARRIALAHGGTIALVPGTRGATFRIESAGMSKRIVVGVAALVVVVAAWFAFFRPSEEDRINKTLTRFVAAVMVKEDDNVLSRTARIKSELAETVDEDVRVDVPDLGIASRGRRAVVEKAAQAGVVFTSAVCELIGTRIEIDPSATTAKVDTVAVFTGVRGSERRIDRRDVHFLLRKQQGDWKITTIDVRSAD